MARSLTGRRASGGSFRPNCLAAAIALAAGGIFVFSFQPQPAGAHLGAKALQTPRVNTSAVVMTSYPGQANSDPATSMPSVSATPALKGKPALTLKFEMLEKGRAKLEGVSDYTATFIKQERVDGSDLQEVQTIHMKLRHAPFSVYMKWLVGPVGQEVLYVDGLHDNRMLVKKGGRMGKLLPSVKLDPHGSLAMGESRHPVTDAGLLTLTAK